MLKDRDMNKNQCHTVFAQCPKCGAVEGLDFRGSQLEGKAVLRESIMSGKWHQEKGVVYHSICGSPCLVLT